MHDLQWNNSTKALLLGQLMKQQGIRYGANCVFVPISKTVGVKLYTNAENRDYSYHNQKRASKDGLGPQVGGRFRFPGFFIVPKGEIEAEANAPEIDEFMLEMYYGYVTQRARAAGYIYSDELQKLKSSMVAKGFSDYDLLDFNLGRIGKRLVCIDFDMNSHVSRSVAA